MYNLSMPTILHNWICLELINASVGGCRNNGDRELVKMNN